jgi:hypothetical protein
VLTEEQTCDESPVQAYRRFQERWVRGKRAAIPPPGKVQSAAAGEAAQSDESDFELQLRSTLA